MRIKQTIFFLMLMCFTSIVCVAQKVDTSKAQKPKSIVVHSPRKAAIMSTILPGSGQVYNKKYWKVPIVYAGLGAFGYFFVLNLKSYNTYAKEIIKRNDTTFKKSQWTVTPAMPANYAAKDLLVMANQDRRYAELSAVGFLVFYSFQIVDAYVDGHLFTFDVSDDLSLKVEPTILPWNRTAGLSFTLGLK